MKSGFTLLLTIIFFSLALVHFYWASGGQLGFEAALPTNEQGVKLLNPSTIDSVLVGVILLFFGLFYMLSSKTPKSKFLIFVRKFGLWIIPTFFALRAMGDFKYAGFFKQIKTTEFAQLDTVLYAPLCMVIALLGFVVAFKNKGLINIKNKN